MKDIDKAFENRWRIKVEKIGSTLVYDPKSHYADGMVSYRFAMEAIKDFCRDFFEAGLMLATEPLVATYNDVCDITCPFEKFWDLYDKKVGKPKCEKLWHKLSMEERVSCINYIPLYKQAQPEKQYRKNPETFLRNKSWNDELIFHNGTNKPTLEEQRKSKLADILTD